MIEEAPDLDDAARPVSDDIEVGARTLVKPPRSEPEPPRRVVTPFPVRRCSVVSAAQAGARGPRVALRLARVIIALALAALVVGLARLALRLSRRSAARVAVEAHANEARLGVEVTAAHRPRRPRRARGRGAAGGHSAGAARSKPHVSARGLPPVEGSVTPRTASCTHAPCAVPASGGNARALSSRPPSPRTPRSPPRAARPRRGRSGARARRRPPSRRPRRRPRGRLDEASSARPETAVATTAGSGHCGHPRSLRALHASSSNTSATAATRRLTLEP